jgi:hypothetical protein
MDRAPQSAPAVKTASRAWSPRALAVISCALALLAAQPAVGQSNSHQRGHLELKSGGSASSLAARNAHADAKKSPLAASSNRSAGADQQPMFFVGTRHLHILATLDILQRLLASEILPPSHQLIPAFHFEALCIGLIDWSPTPRHQRILDHHLSPPLPAERAFAIEHCLLAPPLA